MPAWVPVPLFPPPGAPRLSLTPTRRRLSPPSEKDGAAAAPGERASSGRSGDLERESQKTQRARHRSRLSPCRAEEGDRPGERSRSGSGNCRGWPCCCLTMGEEGAWRILPACPLLRLAQTKLPLRVKPDRKRLPPQLAQVTGSSAPAPARRLASPPPAGQLPGERTAVPGRLCLEPTLRNRCGVVGRETVAVIRHFKPRSGTCLTLKHLAGWLGISDKGEDAALSSCEEGRDPMVWFLETAVGLLRPPSCSH